MLADSRGVPRHFWTVQGDAAAGVDAGDGGQRWGSSQGLVRHEEEEDEKEKRGECGRGGLTLFIRKRVTCRHEKLGGQMMIIQVIKRLEFRKVIKVKRSVKR